MPSVSASSSSAITGNMPATTSTKPSRGTLRAKKTRIVRRRGRGRGAMDSDEEFEREVGTDSEGDDGDNSSVDSSSDLETGPTTEVIPPTNRVTRVLTPGTSRSPDEGQKDEGVSFFSSTPGSAAWSEMVADETANGPADLPVIEFSQLDSHSNNVRQTLKPKKTPKKTAPTPKPTSLPSPPLSAAGDHDEEQPETSQPSITPSRHVSDFPRRPPGQSARQAYKNRLENDPSYVPTVGEFWGHDDRLLDKNLRSLSGWWRGRWQGRSRGRGGFSMRGGRGGFLGRPQRMSTEPQEATETSLPPIEREWKHDGFEEMKKNEDRRKTFQEQQAMRGAGTFRGRGAFAPARGRGVHFGYASFSPSPSRRVLPAVPPAGRTWFVMNPEKKWTKQHEAYLFFDFSTKPRQGQGLRYRVKLPKSQERFVWEAKRPFRHAQSASKAGSTISGSEAEDRIIIVSLPTKSIKGKEKAESSTQEIPIDEVFTVRPSLVEAKPLPLPEPSNQKSGLPAKRPDPAIQQQLEQLSIQPKPTDAAQTAKTEEAVLRDPPSDGDQVVEPPADDRPSLTPLQTNFMPSDSQGSPAFASPYAFPAPLPPGIAVNPLGMTFEVATGRPVYLSPPPPPPMYAPRPIMQPVPFVPGHMRHHSTVMSEYMPQPQHTPPVNGFIDPSMFSFPRQSSAVQIRAPGDARESPAHTSPKTGVLRTDAASFQPASTRPEEGSGNQQAEQERPLYEQVNGVMHNGMMVYHPYPQQYYYPDSAYGGYQPYMDMSQAGGYDMYPAQDMGTAYY